MADVKGGASLFLSIGNLILQLTAAVVNLVTITTNRTQTIAIRALNASRKRLKRYLRRLNRRPKRKQRIWCRPGRTNIWWTNILNNKTSSEEWKENLRMDRRLFDELCERLRPYLTGKNTVMRDALPVETKVAATLYYLADESRYRKVKSNFVAIKIFNTIHVHTYA